MIDLSSDYQFMLMMAFTALGYFQEKAFVLNFKLEMEQEGCWS